jgi:hypothetical protein
MANVLTKAKGGSIAGPLSNQTIQIVKHELDIADFVAAGGATTELFRVVTIPADTYFKLLQVEVVDALSLGGSARIDIGDSADDDEFVSNATTLTAGTNLTLAKQNGSSGDVYTAADHISVKVTGAAIATGKLRFVWEQADCSRNAPAEPQD